MILNRGGVSIRKAIPDDIKQMKGRLRYSDIREVKASHGFEPGEALVHAVSVSTFCATLVFKKRPVVLFGITPDLTRQDLASVWMLATKDLEKINLTFLRLSRPMILLMLRYSPRLYNYVDSRNGDSLKWLAWCGARMSGPVRYGVENLPFYKFTFHRSDYV